MNKLQLESAKVKLIPCIISTGSMIRESHFEKWAAKGIVKSDKICSLWYIVRILDLGHQWFG